MDDFYIRLNTGNAYIAPVRMVYITGPVFWHASCFTNEQDWDKEVKSWRHAIWSQAQMEKNLIVQPEKCTGCRTCEMVCSFVHAGEFNPLRSRITVFTFEKIGLAAPMVCQQCSVAACMEVCPVGAIYRDEVTGAMTVSHDKCLKCKMCTIACPFGASTYDPVQDVIMKCDLCGGKPQCVVFCPSGAITYQDPMQANLAKRKSYAQKLKTIYEEVI